MTPVLVVGSLAVLFVLARTFGLTGVKRATQKAAGLSYATPLIWTAVVAVLSGLALWFFIPEMITYAADQVWSYLTWVGLALAIVGFLVWDFKKFPVLQIGGIVILLIAFSLSGFGEQAGSIITKKSLEASCKADDSQKKCDAIKMKQLRDIIAKQNKIDAENKRRADLKLQREQAKREALKPIVVPCTTTEFTGFINCNRVTIKQGGEAYSQTKTASNNCLTRDDGRSAEVQITGETITYTVKSGYRQATFHVFERTAGQQYKTLPAC
jgi:hypothetical protein